MQVEGQSFEIFFLDSVHYEGSMKGNTCGSGKLLLVGTLLQHMATVRISFQI